MPADRQQKVSRQPKSSETKHRFSFFRDMRLFQSRKMDFVTYSALEWKVSHGDRK